MEKLCILLALVATSMIWTSDSAHAEDGAWVRECGDGCMAVTCKPGDCWMWRCDASGCTIRTRFSEQNVVHTRPDLAEALAGVPIAGCLEQRCAIRACDAQHCSVFGLQADRATLLGRFDNVQVATEQLGRAFLEQGVRPGDGAPE